MLPEKIIFEANFHPIYWVHAGVFFIIGLFLATFLLHLDSAWLLTVIPV